MYTVMEIYHSLFIPLLIAICIVASVDSDIMLLQTVLDVSLVSMCMQACWMSPEGVLGRPHSMLLY